MSSPPIDPDVSAYDRVRRVYRGVLAAVAVGGVAGAEARYGIGLLVPHAGHSFPWSTLLINLLGCALIGALMGALERRRDPHRLARPLLGTGVLGGFTTFSTFAVDVDKLVDGGHAVTALGYAAATLAGCLVAVSAVYRATTSVGQRL